jgi:hypothetical protein
MDFERERLMKKVNDSDPFGSDFRLKANERTRVITNCDHLFDGKSEPLRLNNAVLWERTFESTET